MNRLYRAVFNLYKINIYSLVCSSQFNYILFELWERRYVQHILTTLMSLRSRYLIWWMKVMQYVLLSTQTERHTGWWSCLISKEAHLTAYRSPYLRWLLFTGKPVRLLSARYIFRIPVKRNYLRILWDVWDMSVTENESTYICQFIEIFHSLILNTCLFKSSLPVLRNSILIH